MKTIMLTRGVPGCGKSYWIENNGLKPYTICYDDMRLLLHSPTLGLNGKPEISQKEYAKVFSLVEEILDKRMQNGEFIILDGTHSRRSDFNVVRKLAKKHLYRIVCIDFTDVPVDVIKQRNQGRSCFKRVSDKVIDKFVSRFNDPQNTIPSGILVIKPSEFSNLLFKPVDLSKYKKIHNFGDIHGCNTVLQKYLKDGIKEDEYYVFCGDYIDRGIENVEVLKFLMSIVDLPNVTLLEGNHERWLYKWAHDETVPSETFRQRTQKEIENSDIDKKDISRFYRKLQPCFYYSFENNIFLVSHGGISSLAVHPLFIDEETLIKGVGGYSDVDAVDASFAKSTDSNVYQIHGHRNLNGTGIVVENTNGRCFNLEGEVERGGDLRVVTLIKKEDNNSVFECITTSLKNDVFDKSRFGDLNNLSDNEVIRTLRDSKHIVEKKFGDISSFNFTRDAFIGK